jgi:TetR/AcrR family transcriptional regulator, transcriptional repressor for nem operon
VTAAGRRGARLARRMPRLPTPRYARSGMPRGRPRTFDTDDALDAAMRLFWRAGARDTTTRDLERELGLGQSSITAAFGSKADLLDASLGRYLDLLTAELIVPLRDAPDGLGAIGRFLERLGEWHRAEGGRGCMVGRLMCEGPPQEPRIADRVGAYRAALRQALGAALARAAAAGEIPGGDLERRRDLVVAVVLGMNLALQAGDDDAAHRAIAEAGRAQVAAWRAS